ncbi:MAG: hybrid sensor histidine kinase/response regulator [Flavobacteriales bacterium]|nr:hybrid sensor histidine kinase/response regulator [Flavobacteriales bacterium]|tara:strand:+ start:6385 stop:7830 length:1446 start_codon:yes stop_codon:yes gene_type:complete
MNIMRVLLIDESKEEETRFKNYFKSVSGIRFEVDWENNEKQALQHLLNDEYDLYLIEEDFNNRGIDLLRTARSQGVDKAIIILTEKESHALDLTAMSEGADDYISKEKLSEGGIERSIRYSYERYKSRMRIAQREARYKNLFEKSIDAIVIIDKSLNILEANLAMKKLFKPKDSSLKGKPIKSFFADQSVYEEFADKIFKQGLLKKFNVQLKSEDNQRLYCEITSSVLFNVEHEISGYQLIINDLTKERKTEQRIMRAEKLGMTGRIARSIAHEVRNPLTNINLAIDQLKEECKKDDSAEMYLDLIGRNSERINNLITELLDSAKPSALKIELNSLSKLIDESLELAGDRLQLKGVELFREKKEELTAPIDYNYLKTAILNIIINAIEAMPESNGRLKIREYSSLDEVHIEISDNGVGIDEETLKQLFDPFFTGKQKGMGLGLTSTQNIIQQHGGNIDVESEVGFGTTFTINIPKELNKDE